MPRVRHDRVVPRPVLIHPARPHQPVADRHLRHADHPQGGGVGGDDLGPARSGHQPVRRRPRTIWATCWRSKHPARSRASIWCCSRCASRCWIGAWPTPAAFAAMAADRQDRHDAGGSAAQPAAGQGIHPGRRGGTKARDLGRRAGRSARSVAPRVLPLVREPSGGQAVHRRPGARATDARLDGVCRPPHRRQERRRRSASSPARSRCAISPTSTRPSRSSTASAVTVLRRDGSILVRYPDLDTFIGERMPPHVEMVFHRGARRRAVPLGGRSQPSRRAGSPCTRWRTTTSSSM